MSTEAIIARIRNLRPEKLQVIETVLTSIEHDTRTDAPGRQSSWLAGVDALSERLAKTHGPMPDSVASIRELRDHGPR